MAVVIDDDEAVRRLACRALAAADWQVREASDAAAGLAIVESESAVNAVLTDIVMPGITGREVVEVLSRFRSDLAVVCMTGAASDGTIQLARDCEAPIVRKPFWSSDLTDAVDFAVDRARRRRRAPGARDGLVKAAWELHAARLRSKGAS